MKIAQLFNLSYNGYRLARFSKHKEYYKKYFEDIIKSNNSNIDENFFNNRRYFKYIEQERLIHSHPFVYKVISENSNILTLKIVNLTHSKQSIKINKEIVNKIYIGKYYNNKGQEIEQYAPNGHCIVEMNREHFNNMIINITDSEEINNLGGVGNLNKIIMKIADEWEDKPSFFYLHYITNNIEDCYHKYELDMKKKINESYGDTVDRLDE